MLTHSLELELCPRPQDLSHLNRDLSKVVIIDDEAFRFQLQPENGIAIKPFTDSTDTKDTELLDLIPFLTDLAVRQVPDIREELATYKGKHIPTEFKRRKEEAAASKGKGGLGGLLRRG
jgi:import inner membrane translocase subunit TIM50